MAVAAIKTEDSKELWQFFEKTADRFKYQQFLLDPTVRIIKQKKEIYVVCSMKNKFQFPLFEIGLLGFLAILFTLGIHWSLIIPFLPMAAGVFEKSFFIGWMMKRGLRKEGHTAPVKVLSPDTLNEVLLANG